MLNINNPFKTILLNPNAIHEHYMIDWRTKEKLGPFYSETPGTPIPAPVTIDHAEVDRLRDEQSAVQAIFARLNY